MYQHLNSRITCLCFVVLLLLPGCQSDRPKKLSWPASNQGLASNSERPNQRILFNSVDSTNQIRPEWLGVSKDFFRLGPGDSIDIELLGEPATPLTVTVGPDGKIYYSLLNGTFVWGLTLSEAKELLERSLAKFVRVKPEVALTLRGVGSRRVWILGHVQSPGVYPLAAPLTLLEAISVAGGAVTTPGISDDAADLENSFVIREGKMMRVDFSKLLHH